MNHLYDPNGAAIVIQTGSMSLTQTGPQYIYLYTVALCPYRHAYLSNYTVIGRQLVLLCFLNNISCIKKISHIHEYLLISCILRRYSLSNNLLYMLNCTFSYNKFIYLFVLLIELYLFRNLLSYHRELSLPTSNTPRYSAFFFFFYLVSLLFEPSLVIH